MRKEYTCIICPRSCSLVLTDQDGQISVTGHSCKRGETYGVNEYTHPVRMLTTTVKMAGGTIGCLPVISSDSVPKEKLKDCLEYLYQLEIQAPVKLHDVIVDNILDTGVSILAAKDVKERQD